MRVQGSQPVYDYNTLTDNEKKMFEKGQEYWEKKFDEFYKTQSIKGIGDGVNVDISVEASNYSYEELKASEPSFYCANLNSYKGSEYERDMLHQMSSLDPVAREIHDKLVREYGPGGSVEFDTKWFLDNVFKVGKWQQGGYGAGEIEKKYNSELFLSNRDKESNMFRHIRQLPTRTIMELTTDQYIKIHDQKDSDLTSILEASVKKANEIVDMLDKAADATRQNRLHDTRVGFTIGEDGKTTYYVDARDQETFDWEKSTYHIYASQDINQLVDDVVHKKNGMDHFQYID
ncbi:MAG: hypothetical protein IJ791_08075 [Lachnospiraceae bacterium]|nr:hypothetical protein [Lachnospiraceae bacterium]